MLFALIQPLDYVTIKHSCLCFLTEFVTESLGQAPWWTAEELQVSHSLG